MINLPTVGHAQLKIVEIIEIVTLVNRAPNFSFRERKCGSGERTLLVGVGKVHCWWEWGKYTAGRYHSRQGGHAAAV
jgi:hypothetical protein